MTAEALSSAEDQRLLLAAARRSIEEHFGSHLPAGPDLGRLPGTFGGVFVTLRSGGKLRGCIGTFRPTDDIVATVREYALAALTDPRFLATPVQSPEVEHLRIEISILSPPQKTSSPLLLIPGVHGVLIRRGHRSGCFLPKVAEEHGWSAERFLSECCRMKAGLDADAWRDADTEIYCFTAQVFAEPAGEGGP